MKQKYWTGFVALGILLGSWIYMTSCSINTDPYFSQLQLEPFDTLTLNSVFNVRLVQGDHYGVEVSGAQEVAETITFHIENKTLFVNNNDGPLWKHPRLEPPTIIITFITLRRMKVEETCNISSDNAITTDTFGITLGSKLNIAELKLNCHLFYYWNSSPVGGDLTLSGHSDFVRFYNGSLLSIDASQLITHDALIANGSQLDVHVYADQHLYYSITGTGNIYLTGDPAVIDAGPITSSGKLFQ
jgi:hypothetical protein